MREVHLLNECDAWHSWASMNLLGAFTNRKALKRFLSRMKRAGEISPESYDELLENGQTFGLDTNFHIQTEDLNPEYEKG